MALQRLVGASNQYLGTVLKPTEEGSYKLINLTLLRDVAQYLTRILTTFGVIAEDDDRFGFAWPASSSALIEQQLGATLDVFTRFRDAVRNAARTKQSSDEILGLVRDLVPHHDGGAAAPITPEHAQVQRLLQQFAAEVQARATSPNELLELCDQVRNDWLPLLGVRFEDDSISKGRSEWKLDDVRATLKDLDKRRHDDVIRAELGAEKERKKQEAARAKAAQEQERLERLQIAPDRFFAEWREYAGKFREFDQEHLPTVDIEGNAVSKPMRKKLAAVLKKHTTEYQKHHGK